MPTYLPIFAKKYCSGRFYFLSRSAISSLLNKIEEISKEGLDDYAIGLNLDDRFKTNVLNIATNNYFVDMDLNNSLT